VTDDWPIFVLFCENFDTFFVETNVMKQLWLYNVVDFLTGFRGTMFVKNLLHLSLADYPILSPTALNPFVRILPFSNDIETVLGMRSP
jgi:hypothetical protein